MAGSNHVAPKVESQNHSCLPFLTKVVSELEADQKLKARPFVTEGVVQSDTD